MAPTIFVLIAMGERERERERESSTFVCCWPIVVPTPQKAAAAASKQISPKHTFPLSLSLSCLSPLVVSQCFDLRECLFSIYSVRQEEDHQNFKKKESNIPIDQFPICVPQLIQQQKRIRDKLFFEKHFFFE